MEQLQYSYPDEHWGTKRSGPNAPPSKDVVATQSPFEGADIQSSAGELIWREHNASNDPNWAAQAQYWFSYPAVNHLAETVEEPQQPEKPPEDTVNLEEFFRRVVRDELASIDRRLQDIEKRIVPCPFSSLIRR